MFHSDRSPLIRFDVVDQMRARLFPLELSWVWASLERWPKSPSSRPRCARQCISTSMSVKCFHCASKLPCRAHCSPRRHGRDSWESAGSRAACKTSRSWWVGAVSSWGWGSSAPSHWWNLVQTLSPWRDRHHCDRGILQRHSSLNANAFRGNIS